jgi:putative transposase
MPRSLAALSVPQAVRELKRMGYEEEGWSSVHEMGRVALQHLLQEHLKRARGVYVAEQSAWGVADRCNGYYQRDLLTSMGTVRLAIPRTRTLSVRVLLGPYARRDREVDRLILGCFLFGLSTRKVGEALLSIRGERVSPSTVSRVARSLDQAVRAFHRRPLSDRYRVLVLDGVVLSRRTGAGALKRPVLVALGITASGRQEILDFRVAAAETQANWEAFLTDLHERGLGGRSLEMILTDGGAGLLAAFPLVYPQIPEQRCWAHKTRNVLEKMGRKEREQAKADLHRISHARNLRDARSAARQFGERWGERAPKAVRCLTANLEKLLTFFRFRDPDWRQRTRTTNAIERRFREVRRRTRPMGSFADRTSIERILFAVFSYENQKERTGTPFLLTQNS